MTLQKYMYANGSPVIYIDPSGYFSIQETITTSLIIGSLATLATLVPSSPVSVGVSNRIELHFTRIGGIPFIDRNNSPVAHTTLVVAQGSSRKTAYDAGPSVTQRQNPDPFAPRGFLDVRDPEGKPYQSNQYEDLSRTKFIDFSPLPVEYVKQNITKTLLWIKDQKFQYDAIPLNGKPDINSNSAISQSLVDLGYPRSILKPWEAFFVPGWNIDLRGDASLPRL